MSEPDLSTLDPSLDRLISRRQLRAVVPWSDTTLWRKIRTGRFPAPVPHLSAHGRRLWRLRDVRGWQDGGASAA